MPRFQKNSETEETIEEDKNGQYSLVMPNDYAPSLDPLELECIFSQAGKVSDVHIAQMYTFIRYFTSHAALKAIQLFGIEYRVKAANISDKYKKNHMTKKERQHETDQVDNSLSNAYSDVVVSSAANTNAAVCSSIYLFAANIESESEFEKLIRPYRPKSVNFVNKSGKIMAYVTMASESAAVQVIEELGHKFQRTRKLYVTYDTRFKPDGSLVNGHKTGKHNTSFESTTSSVRSSPTAQYFIDSSESKLNLFASNIESEDDFKQLIKPYRPKSVKVISKDDKIIGFITMDSESSAAQVIEELSGTVQKTKKLFIKYNQKPRPEKNNANDDTVSIASGTSQNTQNNKMKYASQLQDVRNKDICDFITMPKLIHEDDVLDIDKYYLDWRISVANFPQFSLESTIKNAFSKYHILDICIENNNSSYGCTKAVLYLATVNDVINAVKEMNGCQLEGQTLEVDVPKNDSIQYKLVSEMTQES